MLLEDLRGLPFSVKMDCIARAHTHPVSNTVPLSKPFAVCFKKVSFEQNKGSVKK
jgi:hypothetical protein